jgi:alkylresorcinol/alkylpyrone synthase
VSQQRVVLADFVPVQMQGPVRQEYLLSYLAWLLASARCAAAGVSDQDEATSILHDVQQSVRRYGISPKFIARRQFNAFPDSNEALGQGSVPPSLPARFPDLSSHPSGPTLDVRMQEFEGLALDVFRRCYAHTSKAPDDLIHVSCSGYASPSPAQRVLSEKGWYSTTVTHSYHMGCYGAFPAIRTAVGLLSAPALAQPEPKARVDIVHTEYLSGHVATLKGSPADIIDMTLFGDGFIAYSAYPEHAFRNAAQQRPGFAVVAHHEQLIPSSLEEMTWKLGPHQFDMHLSKNVPLLIRDHLLGLVRGLCVRAGIEFEREKLELAYAIHPGGPKILDHARDVLGLDEAHVAHSRRVFHELGNMSSATVPFILMGLATDAAIPVGSRILALGFGPGLTATGLMLQKL